MLTTQEHSGVNNSEKLTTCESKLSPKIKLDKNSTANAFELVHPLDNNKTPSCINNMIGQTISKIDLEPPKNPQYTPILPSITDKNCSPTLTTPLTLFNRNKNLLLRCNYTKFCNYYNTKYFDIEDQLKIRIFNTTKYTNLKYIKGKSNLDVLASDVHSFSSRQFNDIKNIHEESKKLSSMPGIQNESNVSIGNINNHLSLQQNPTDNLRLQQFTMQNLHLNMDTIIDDTKVINGNLAQLLYSGELPIELLQLFGYNLFFKNIDVKLSLYLQLSSINNVTSIDKLCRENSVASNTIAEKNKNNIDYLSLQNIEQSDLSTNSSIENITVQNEYLKVLQKFADLNINLSDQKITDGGRKSGTKTELKNIYFKNTNYDDNLAKFDIPSPFLNIKYLVTKAKLKNYLYFTRLYEISSVFYKMQDIYKIIVRTIIYRNNTELFDDHFNYNHREFLFKFEKFVNDVCTKKEIKNIICEEPSDTFNLTTDNLSIPPIKRHYQQQNFSNKFIFKYINLEICILIHELIYAIISDYKILSKDYQLKPMLENLDELEELLLNVDYGKLYKISNKYMKGNIKHCFSHLVDPQKLLRSLTFCLTQLKKASKYKNEIHQPTKQIRKRRKSNNVVENKKNTDREKTLPENNNKNETFNNPDKDTNKDTNKVKKLKLSEPPQHIKSLIDKIFAEGSIVHKFYEITTVIDDMNQKYTDVCSYTLNIKEIISLFRKDDPIFIKHSNKTLTDIMWYKNLNMLDEYSYRIYYLLKFCNFDHFKHEISRKFGKKTTNLIYSLFKKSEVYKLDVEFILKGSKNVLHDEKNVTLNNCYINKNDKSNFLDELFTISDCFDHNVSIMKNCNKINSSSNTYNLRELYKFTDIDVDKNIDMIKKNIEPLSMENEDKLERLYLGNNDEDILGTEKINIGIKEVSNNKLEDISDDHNMKEKYFNNEKINEKSTKTCENISKYSATNQDQRIDDITSKKQEYSGKTHYYSNNIVGENKLFSFTEKESNLHPSLIEKNDDSNEEAIKEGENNANPNVEYTDDNQNTSSSKKLPEFEYADKKLEVNNINFSNLSYINNPSGKNMNSEMVKRSIKKSPINKNTQIISNHFTGKVRIEKNHLGDNPTFNNRELDRKYDNSFHEFTIKRPITNNNNSSNYINHNKMQINNLNQEKKTLIENKQVQNNKHMHFSPTFSKSSSNLSNKYMYDIITSIKNKTNNKMNGYKYDSSYFADKNLENRRKSVNQTVNNNLQQQNLFPLTSSTNIQKLSGNNGIIRDSKTASPLIPVNNLPNNMNYNLTNRQYMNNNTLNNRVPTHITTSGKQMDLKTYNILRARQLKFARTQFIEKSKNSNNAASLTENRKCRPSILPQRNDFQNIQSPQELQTNDFTRQQGIQSFNHNNINISRSINNNVTDIRNYTQNQRNTSISNVMHPRTSNTFKTSFQQNDNTLTKLPILVILSKPLPSDPGFTFPNISLSDASINKDNVDSNAPNRNSTVEKYKENILKNLKYLLNSYRQIFTKFLGDLEKLALFSANVSELKFFMSFYSMEYNFKKKELRERLILMKNKVVARLRDVNESEKKIELIYGSYNKNDMTSEQKLNNNILSNNVKSSIDDNNREKE